MTDVYGPDPEEEGDAPGPPTQPGEPAGSWSPLPPPPYGQRPRRTAPPLDRGSSSPYGAGSAGPWGSPTGGSTAGEWTAGEPTAGGWSAGEGSPYFRAEPTGVAGGWSAPPARRPPSTIALATVAAVIAGFVGVAIGSTLFHRKTTGASLGSPLAPFIPFAPANPTGNGSIRAATPQEQAVRSKVDPGVVDINTQLGFQSAAAAGTGMILTANGRVLTNNHVIDGATQIRATLVTTRRTYTATVVGTDPTDDVAVIQLQGASGLTPANIGNSSAVGPGDTVYAIGNAGGLGGTPSVTSGVVQATNQTITASDPGGVNAEQLSGLLQTNAPMEPGDSGGPLALSSGAVIGMDTAASGRGRFQSSAAIGFAIPIAHAVSVANQINAGHASSTVHLGLPAFLGVQILPGNSGTSSSGAQVDQVVPDSPAAGTGLTSGDTITSVNGQNVNSSTALTNLLRRYRPGDTTTIGWLDASGTPHQARVTLAAGPAD